MAVRKVFTEKELKQMVADLEVVGATKASVSRKWGIAASTLTRRITEFQDKLAKIEVRKAAKKHTRLTQDEKDQIIKLYVDDDWTMSAIAKLLLRSAGAVKRALEHANIPVRGRGKRKEQPITIGDTENPLAVGDRVFSFVYNAYATVEKLWGVDGDVFRIWVDSESHKFSAYQPREKLALITK